MNAARPSRTARAIPAAIFVLALALRLLFLSAHSRPLASDARDYDQLGWTLAEKGRYATDVGPTAYRAPGYPAFIASVYAVAGHRPQAVKIAQAVLDSLTAVLLFLLLRRSGLAAASVAGIAWALFPPAIVFSGDLLAEALVAFGVTAFAWLAAEDRVSADVIAGALLGGLILIKPAMLLFAAAVPLALAKRSSARPTTAILGIALVPVILWVLRNLLVVGTPLLTTGFGVNLLVGNNTHATGGYIALSAADAPPAVGNERDDDRAAGRAAMAAIRRDPGRALAIGARKLMLLASSEAELTAGAFTDAVPGTRLRERYRSVPIWLRSVMNIPTAAVLLLGVFGLATRRSGAPRATVLARAFYALLLAMAISSVVFFGSSRFRFPLMPFLILMGAEFVTDLDPRLRGTGGKRIVAAAGVCLGIAAVWAGELAILAGHSG